MTSTSLKAHRRSRKPYWMAGACLALFTTAGAAADVAIDGIRAVVNDGVVLESEVRDEALFIKQQAQSNRQSLPDDAVLDERVLDVLIDQEIRRQHAARLGIVVDATSVNRAIEQIARNNNMDTLQFRDTLQGQGFNYNYFRRNIEQELLMQRLIQRDVEAGIRVSAQEIDDFVDAMRNDAEEQQRYRLRHILIAVPPSAPASELGSARQKAVALRQRILAGEEFAVIAAAESDGARALQGGDLGWRTLQEVPAFLASALRTLKPGEVSEPLSSANGLHLVLLEDRQSNNQSEQAETLARHIFLSGDSPELEARLQQVRSRLAAGEAFDTLAAEISEDPNSAPNGGELPWFPAGQMPPPLEEAADALAIGELSQPFRTQFGWHVLQVLDRRTRDIGDGDLRRRAEEALRQRKVEQETERWSQRLRDDSFVDVRS